MIPSPVPIQARLRRSSLPPSAVRRIFHNLARLLGGKAGAGIISLAYMVIAIRVLGPSDYGVLILVHTFAMMVGGVIEFPGWHAVVRYGAQAVEAGDKPRLARLLRFATSVEAAGGACAVLTAAVLGPMIGARLGWSQTALDFALPYSLATLATVRATAAGLLQLRGRFDLLAAHVLVSPVVRLVGAILIAWRGGGLHAFLVLWLSAALLEWATMWALGIYVARQTMRHDVPLRGHLAGVRTENARLWPFMIGANLDATLSELGPRLTPLVVGWTLGPVGAALFAVAQRASSVIAQPAQLLGQAAYAELAHLVAAGGREGAIRPTLLRSILFAVAFSAPLVLVIAAAPARISMAIGGARFADAGAIMLLIAIGRLAYVAAPLASSALVALGRPALSVKVNLFTTLGLLPLLPLFIHWLGTVGAGWHALLQFCTGSALLTFLALRESDKFHSPLIQSGQTADQQSEPFPAASGATSKRPGD